MSDLISQGEAWLAGMRKTSLSRPITYQRVVGLTTRTASLLATVGQARFSVEDSNGTASQIETRDYIVLANDLIFPGDSPPNYITPVGGDVIIETVRGSVLKFEVLPQAAGPAFEDSGRDKNSIRIHTKYVGTT